MPALFVLALGAGALAAQYTVSQVTNNYAGLDISTSGTDRTAQFVAGGTFDPEDEGKINDVPLGFTFTFFGAGYTSVDVAANGFLTFSDLTYNSYVLPTAIPATGTPNNFIAAVYSDLGADTGFLPGTSRVYTQTLGTAPNREFRVQYVDWPNYGSTTTLSSFVYRLLENGNEIECHFGTVMNTGFRSGIENSGGTEGYASAAGFTRTSQPTQADRYVPPAPPANVTITTTALPAGLVNSAYNFTVSATGGTPSNYSWSATGLPAPLAINASTGEITGTPTAGGSFPVVVSLTDGATNDSENFTLNISRYTPPTYTNGTAFDDYIDDFELNTISNLNTGSATGPDYTDYSSSHSTTLYRGASYNAIVASGPVSQTVGIYIDYNQNGLFDTGGNEFVGGAVGVSSAGATIQFTVPATAALGATGLRVRAIWNATNPIDPYANGSYGECEDYEVIIADPPATAPVLGAPTAPVVSSPILITEFTTNTVIDGLEIQNVSGASFDATGWQVILSNDYTNINTAHGTTQTLGVMTAGQAIYWTDGTTNPWGGNIFWDPTGTGWIMLVDASGNVRDFVAFNWNATAIAGMSVNAGGFTALSPGAGWSGDGITDSGNVYGRIGTSDNDDSSDWQDNGATDSWGATNTGLTLPFAVSGGFVTLGGTDPSFTGQCVVGDDLQVTFSATDINSADTLTFTISENAGSTISAAAAGYTQAFPYSPAGGASPQSVMLTGTAATTGVLVLDIQVSDGSLTDTYTFTLTIDPPPGDIDVQRQVGTSLGDGTTATDALGNVPTTGDTFTYTIANVAVTGSGDINLTGTGIVDAPTATQTNCTVSVNVTGTNTLITAQGSTTFEVTVTPSGTTNFSFTLDIASDDPDEPTYTITVSGTGVIPNGSPQVAPATGAWVNAGSGVYTLTLDPGDAIADDLQATDPENDDMTVNVVSAPTFATLTASPASNPTPTAGPLTLAWAGTADAGNPPGDYDWTIEISDGVNTTTITARITINDLPPAHAILDASGGDGSTATPYTTEYTETMDGTAFVDLATVTDPNTSQTPVLGTVTNGSGNPAGGAGFTFTVSAGMLTIAPNGTLGANDVGTHTFVVEVSDGTNSVDIEVSVAVAAQPAITTASPLANGEQGQAYAATITATGGTGALTFAVSAGSLPGGLSLDAAGNLSGTPTANGAFNFTLEVTDALGVSNTAVFDLTIDPPATGAPTITTTSLTGGTLNQPYGPVSINATGGAGGYSFAVSSGTLPPGLALSTAGEISGTPTMNGTFPFDVTVTDAAFATDTATLGITIVVSSTGGGGGGSGGNDGGGGCAGHTGASYWLLLLAAGAALLLGLRRRTA